LKYSIGATKSGRQSVRQTVVPVDRSLNGKPVEVKFKKQLHFHLIFLTKQPQ
jgi:hypothetical protein